MKDQDHKIENAIITRCSVCQAIELNGTLISRSQYDPKELEEQGYMFSDGCLSQECYIKGYGDFAREVLKDDPSLIPRVSCPKNTDERLKDLEVMLIEPCPVCEKDRPHFLNPTEVKDLPNGYFLVIYKCGVCGDPFEIDSEKALCETKNPPFREDEGE